MSERRRLYRDEAFVRRGRTEPIDGLLRITAPHEWVFLALLGCALIGVLAWTFLGTVERGLSAPCFVVSGAGAGADATAVAMLPTDDARGITVGMPARVNLLGADGSLDALVSEVGLGPSDLPASSGLPAGDHTLLVRIDPLTASPLLGNGHPCDVRIVTSREAPIRLITDIGRQ